MGANFNKHYFRTQKVWMCCACAACYFGKRKKRLYVHFNWRLVLSSSPQQRYKYLVQGRNEGVKGAQFPWRRMTTGGPKSPNNVTSTFFNTVYLFPKDLKFEHGGTKLASSSGRHLTSLRPRSCPTRWTNQDLHYLWSIHISLQTTRI